VQTILAQLYNFKKFAGRINFSCLLENSLRSKKFRMNNLAQIASSAKNIRLLT
jgi:hypothetical protein